MARTADVTRAQEGGVDFGRETTRDGLWRYLTDIKSDSSSCGK